MFLRHALPEMVAVELTRRSAVTTKNTDCQLTLIVRLIQSYKSFSRIQHRCGPDSTLARRMPFRREP